MHGDHAFWTRWFGAGPAEDRALARLMAVVPVPRRFYEPDELRLTFPQVFNDPELPGGPVWGLVFDRIAPVSEAYSQHIISRYVDPKLQAEALTHPKNQYGLLMLYLGTEHGRPATDPKVGNRPLSLPQLVGEIGKEGVVELAETMAATLAVLHWSAHLDGQHVRFVAGHQPSRHHRTVYLSHIQRLHPFSPDGETVRSRLVPNFLANKSWPRPVVSTGEGVEVKTDELKVEVEGEEEGEKEGNGGDGDAFRREVWLAFRSLYLDIAAYVIYRDKDMLGEEYGRRSRLPAIFIHTLEAIETSDTDAHSNPSSSSSETPEPYKRTAYDDYRERGPRPGEGEGSRMGPSRMWGARLRAGAEGERRGENTQFVVRKERELMNIEEEGVRDDRDDVFE